MAGGNRVFTATANGAFPPGLLGCRTPVVSDDILIPYNDTLNTDAGIFTFTAVGDASNPWVLTQKTGANTAAALQGSTVRVIHGIDKGLWVCRQGAITALGTDPLLWAKPGYPDARYGFYADATFAEWGTTSNTIGKADFTLAPAVYRGWTVFASGGTVGNAARVTVNDGSATMCTGIVASSGQVGLFTRNADFSLARTEWEFATAFEIPIVSDGTNAYTVSIGLGTGATDSSRLAFTPTAGATMSWVTTVASSVGSTLSLGTFAINTKYRLLVRKVFGVSTADVWWDNGSGSLVLIGTTSALPSAALALTPGFMLNGIGVSNTRTMKVYPTYAWRLDPKAVGV
jgi:hypothetical protein